MRRLIPEWLGLMLLPIFLSVWSSLTFAACTVSTTPVALGQYDVFSNAATDSTGSVTVSCDTSTSYNIALSAGSGSLTERTLVDGAHVLGYNLFTDAARTTVWGDGNATTSTVSGTTAGPAQHTVYGRVPARQNVQAGSYSDVIVVTVTY